MADIENRPAPHSGSFPRNAFLLVLVSIAAAFAVVLSGHSTGFLQRFEQGFADFRGALFSDRITSDHPDVVIISVGGNVTRSRATFDRAAVEFDRAQLARLIEQIDESAPRAIGFDVPLRGAGDPSKDEALQKALREAKARVVVGVRSDSAQNNPERATWLSRFIAGTGRAAGHISTFYDEGQGRAVRVEGPASKTGRLPNSFALLVARALRPETVADHGTIAWLQKVDEDSWLARYISVGGQQPFRTLYAEELLDANRPLAARQLAGRLVLVTTGIAEIERHRTPLTSWTGEALAPIQIQAQAIAQLLDRRSVGEVLPQTLRLGLFTLACLAGIIGWYRGPGWHVPGTLLALAILLMADAMAFSWRDLALPIIPAAIVWLLAEAAGRGLRRIVVWEERNGQSWPIEVAGSAKPFEAPREAPKPASGG